MEGSGRAARDSAGAGPAVAAGKTNTSCFPTSHVQRSPRRLRCVARRAGARLRPLLPPLPQHSPPSTCKGGVSIQLVLIFLALLLDSSAPLPHA